jgi:signal peptide peptidase SppA
MPIAKSPTGCRADQLFGLWLMDPDVLESYRVRAVAIDLEKLARMNAEAEAREAKELGDGPPPKPYAVADGIAVVPMAGPTTKYPTSYSRVLGGTSTMLTERAIAQAVDDPDVKAVMIHMDGVPGGTVAGAFELADRIRALKTRKPIVAHADDQATSAGYLFGAVCDRFTVNRTGEVGSVGTRSHLIDSSEQAKKDGVRVIPIAAGKYKAAGLPGTEVTDDQVKDFQRRIDALNDQFVNDVAQGRNLDPQAVRDLEARCYVGHEAVKLGLVDGVTSFEGAMGQLRNELSLSGAGGSSGAVLKPAAPNTRSADMALLDRIRDVFGAAEMTEDAAVAKVRAAATAQATAATDIDRLTKERDELKEKLPKAADPAALTDRAEALCDRIDALAEGTKIPVTKGKALKALFMGEDGKTPNAALIPHGKAILAAVTAGNRTEEEMAADRLKERSELSEEKRETPGDTKEKDAPKEAVAKVTSEYVGGKEYAGPKVPAAKK